MMDDDLEALRAERDALRAENERKNEQIRRLLAEVQQSREERRRLLLASIDRFPPLLWPDEAEDAPQEG